MKASIVTSLSLLLLLLAVTSAAPRRSRREACWLGSGVCGLYCRLFGPQDAKEGQCINGTCRCLVTVGGPWGGNGGGGGGYFPPYNGNGNSGGGGYFPPYNGNGDGGFGYGYGGLYPQG